MDTRRLVVVSNRLPIVLKKNDQGRWVSKPGSGGLVTALGPILRDRGGLWIGWLGTTSREVADPGFLNELLARGAIDTGHILLPVDLTREDVDKYYYGFSNEVLWPLFHDLHSHCNFDPSYWPVYERVNRKFARAIADHTGEEDYIWVHDYHLLLIARELKRLGVKRHLGFFLHIPFPSPDIFMRMPWRFEVLEALLDYDLLGLQTVRDRRNFSQCARMLTRGTHVVGRGQVARVVTPQRETAVGAFPISIDYREFTDLAASEEVARQAWIIHRNLPDRKLILGVDRLDYTKGIPHRLQALANAFDRFPELRRRVTFIQVAVPSRTNVQAYQELKQEIEQLVGEINGRFTEVGWTPIHYIFRSLNRIELVGYYRTCEIALVTPLKDGMNLVAKEYCASSIEEDGVLILSEFAGAAGQLHQGALIVNPYDIEAVANAIHQAFHMEHDERVDRMRRLRRSIQKSNIFNWVNAFLRVGIEKKLNDFPHMELFVPTP